VKALVVDDEPVARRRLVRMLGRIDGVDVVGEAVDGEDALAQIDRLAPDVVFLDIRMPGRDGLAVARSRPLPAIVFTTAYAEHAVEAFAAAAVDYLLKPVEQRRLEEAVGRATAHRERFTAEALARHLERSSPVAPAPPRLAARRGASSWLVDPREVGVLRAAAKYVVFTHGEREHVLDESLEELTGRLGALGFRRVHRGALVNLGAVRAAHRTARGLSLELADGQTVPVSRRRAAEILEALGLRS
jgi:two-component system LytT family response regulator